MLGKTLPSIRGLWDASKSDVFLGYGLSFGQYALGALLAIVILVPVFGLAPESAALLEVAFTGGHGTAAGLSGTFEDVGRPVPDRPRSRAGDDRAGRRDRGRLVAGSLGCPIAADQHRAPVAADTRGPPRSRPVGPLRLTERDGGSGRHRRGVSRIAPLTTTAVAIGLAILVGWVILEGLRALERMLTGDDAIMSLMPLFPMTIIGGMLVQFAAVRTGVATMIDRRRVNEVAGLSLDVLILTAIGTMSLAAIGANLGAPAVMSATAIGWSVFGVLVLAPRLFNSRWFENSLGRSRKSEGTIVTGFMLIDMADPAHMTGATELFGYKQLLFEPFVGGGLITAMAVPFIHAFGDVAMLVVATIATLAVLGIGFRVTRG